MRFLNAIGFLTILKVPEKYYIKTNDYPKILVYFPLAGFIIGVFNAVLFTTLNFFMPLFVSILFIAGFDIIITGGIHMDGAADVFDGVFSGEKDKVKIMEIMKKGDIGVFGGLALLFSAALKISFLYFIAKALNLSNFLSFDLSLAPPVLSLDFQFQSLMVFILAVVFMPVFGRLSMIYLFSKHKPAIKGKSLSCVFSDRSNAEVFWLSVIYISVLFIGFFVFTQIGFFNKEILSLPAIQSMQAINGTASPGANFFNLLSSFLFYSRLNMSLEIFAVVFALKAIAMIVFTFLFSASIGRFFTRRIGGLSGDIIGAVCVFTEIFFIFLYYIFLRLV